jgi:hypothetical protein
VVLRPQVPQPWPKGKKPLQGLITNGKIILKRLLGEYDFGCGLDSSGSEWGQVTSCYEYGNGHSCYMIGGKFFDYLSDY